jgi:hypothetical protein
MTKMNRREFVQATAAVATVPTALFDVLYQGKPTD